MLKSVVEVLKRQCSEHSDILAHVEPAQLAELEATSRADWFDAQLMFTLSSAIDAHLGREAYTQFWIDFGRVATHIPLLKQLAEGAARMFGSGRGVAKMLPRSFGLVARDLGNYEVAELRESDAILKFSEFAYPEHFELFAEATRASSVGALLFVGTTPTAKLVEMDARQGSFSLQLSW